MTTTGFPRAVLFDLLTALLDSWSLWDAAAGSRASGRAWRVQYLRLTYGCGAYVPYEQLVRDAARAAGLQAAAADALEARWLELAPWSGAQEALDALQGRTKLAIVTNCSQRLGLLAAGRLCTRWDCVVTAEAAGHYKPDPRPYLLALDSIGVPASEAAFVAGSGYDLIGTAAVGLRSYWHNRVGLARPARAAGKFRIADARSPGSMAGRTTRMTLARTMIGRCSRSAIAGIAILSLATAAAAQVPSTAPDAVPTRPLTLIVPFPAGGPSDALARALAQGMSVHLKQAIVVENVSGASGTIGLAKLVKSAPDGTTLAFGTVGTHVANAALYKKLPYDPLVDFEAVGLAGTAPTMLVARPSLPASDLPGFLAYADANRAKATYGSAGVGSISHFACVILLSALKQNITHVPYRGVAPAMNDLMGGHIDVMCDQSTTALPQVAGGKIKALAVLTDRRLAQLPEVATAASFGYGDVNIRAWNALFAPKGTPAAVVGRLNDALRAAVADGDLRRQMQAVGVDLPAPADLAPRTVSELIAAGLARDVPALRARGEYLD